MRGVCILWKLRRGVFVGFFKMVFLYIFFGFYGFLLEMEKFVLLEVFYIDDLLNFSCEDIGGFVVGGEL